MNQTQYPAGKNTVQNDRSRNGEDFASDAVDLSFFLVFNSRRGYRVSEPGNGNKSACSTEFNNGRIKVKAGKKHTDENKNKRAETAGHFLIHIQ